MAMKTIWKTVPKDNWSHARAMRRKPSPPEQRLWDALKSHSAGAHFRRQHPIGGCIVDFCAPRHRLVVEVDGSAHAEISAQEYDETRDALLREQGFRVLHFTAHEVMNNLDGVVAIIAESIDPPCPKNMEEPSTPTPISGE